MTARIFRSIFLVATAVLLASFILIFGMLYEHLGQQIQAELLGGWQLQKVLRPFLPLFGRFDAVKLPDVVHVLLGVGLDLVQQLLAVVLLLSGNPVKAD